MVGPALVAVLAQAGPVAHAAAQNGDEEIAAVGFVGNQAFTDGELRRAVFTQSSSCPLVLAVTTCALGIEWGRDRSYFSPRVLDDDVERLRWLYLAHGFRGVAIEHTLSRSVDGDVSVQFRIEEGEPYRIGSISLVGDTLPPELADAAEFPVGVGDPLSFLLLEEARDTLTLRLRNAGFAQAEVFRGTFLPAGSDRASVSYRVDLGPVTTFGPVRVVGNALLDESAILDRLPFREGELYQESRIREAQRSLHQLEIVARARVWADSARVESDSVMPILVEVVEGDPRRVRAQGGLNSAECINFEGRWASRNFAGGGRILQARALVSNLLASTLQSTHLCSQAGTGPFGRVNWLLGLDFNQPSFFSRSTSLLAGIFAERQSRKNIFVRDAFGVDIALRRSLGINSFANLRFRPQLSRLSAAEVTLCATFLACAPEDIEVLSGANWLSPVALSFNRDESDDLFSPTTGYRALLDLEFADRLTGSDYAYVRAFADASIYRAIDRRTVLAVRLRVGRVGPGGLESAVTGQDRFADVVPSQKRFYGGGANSLRGFAQSTLGPRSLSIPVEELLRRRASDGTPICPPTAVRDLICDGTALAELGLYQVRPIGGLATLEASAELRFGLTDGLLGGAAFVDVGQVWPRGFDFRDLEVSPGVGLRYNTRFGPIRADIAYSFRGLEPLQVVTSQIRPFVVGADSGSDRIDIAPAGAASEYINWVVSEDLAILGLPVMFGDDHGFSLRRFQLHFSIGQAF